jgi:hypothetical protein
MRSALLWLALASTACPPSAGARADAGADTGQPPVLDAATPPAPQVVDAATGDDALPPSSSDELTTRAKHLLEAIAHDDPGLATDIVFPREAYLSAKDATDPGKQWDTKVITHFQRQIHALHRRTKGVERAAFVTFELGEPVVQAVPRKHDLKRSLWRVHHCRLTYTIDGKAQHIDVSELTSWRGAWYLTRLHGST